MCLHISNEPEIPLKTFLKLLVDTFVTFLRREVIIISLCNEKVSGFRFINDNSKKENGLSLIIANFVG